MTAEIKVTNIEFVKIEAMQDLFAKDISTFAYNFSFQRFSYFFREEYFRLRLEHFPCFPIKYLPDCVLPVDLLKTFVFGL